MISKYVFGNPFETEAVVNDCPLSQGLPSYGQVEIRERKQEAEIQHEDKKMDQGGADSTMIAAIMAGAKKEEPGFTFTYTLGKEDRVYGLGENVRGINKRGFIYISDCSDDPKHQEDTRSLYAAHNFIIVVGEKTFGLFLDYPTTMTFDIGYTSFDQMKITCERADLKMYVIDGENPYQIVKQFRKMIGRSYIAPKFGLGYGQSRWGYKTKDEFRKVVREHREAGIPLDMVYMDIDYMQSYKDFTLNEKEFKEFPEFVQELKDQHIRLVPIIDAGVKIEEGYDVYEEGVANNYFCKREDGSDFVAEVWPGWTHFPDFLNPDARRWFGDKYRYLVEQGIEGFWNDMNEPAIFKSKEGLEEAKTVLHAFLEDPEKIPLFAVGWTLQNLNDGHADYKRFYHNVNGTMVCHADVHNLFGYNMTRAAGESFERNYPDRRILMFSRSSYIGMHRYGGIWQGDNLSWWSHLLMNLKMMPSLNMVGILYTGADIGGFGSNSSRDLLLRWLALGVFTPLMRNHSAMGTREQEFYQFEQEEDFRNVIGVRYRLLPYIYSEYMKASLRDEMMFRPLAFEYPDDKIAVQTEDQLLIGDQIMIAPVYTQNATGRYVYLPEDMKLVKFLGDGSLYQEEMKKGIHFVEIALEEVAIFIRKGRAIPLAPFAEYVEAVDYASLTMLGYDGAVYELYNDDGFGKDYDNPENYRVLSK